MRRVKRILLNDAFILVLIVVNAIVIFVQGFDLSRMVSNALEHIDNLITLLFLLELMVKLNAFGLRNYLKSNWNKFDFVLIIMAVPSLYYWAFNGNSTQLEYVLVLRISRVFKFFRFLRFFPDIDHLIAGVQRALKASVIVLAGFMVYNFVISVLSCFMFRNIAYEYFANPLVSFYTIFKIFTVEGWYEIPDFIAQNTNETVGFLTKVYFVLIVITGGIFGLSLVNSIFVDAMVSDNNEALEQKVSALEEKIDKLIDLNMKG